MDLSQILPFLGTRKLFDSSAYSTPDQAQGPSLQPSIGQAIASDSGSPNGGLDDQVAQITKLLLDRLNQPDPNVDRLNQLYNDFPQRTKPSFFRSLMGHALGSDIGAPAGSAIMNGDYNRKVGDWALKNKAAEQIANTDIKGQQTETANAVRGINSAIVNERTKNQADKDQRETETKLAKMGQDLELANNKLELAKTIAENNKNNQQAQTDYHNLQLSALNMQRQLDNALHQNQLSELIRNHDLENKQKDAAGWIPVEVNDPDNPGQKMTIRMNSRTGETSKFELGGNQVTGAQKLGAPSSSGTTGPNGQPLTSSTRTMMEGAQMLYPHIAETGKLAADLNKRGLFGPVMSRVRDIAAKVGTTGDPGKVQQNFEEFSRALANDPVLSKSNDAAVGQFITTLGLLASGAGRVHGGARGGGSIQMVNYMKTLLSSDSTLSMFNGRLAALDSFMKQYAAGPAQPKTKTLLDKAIEDVLGGK